MAQVLTQAPESPEQQGPNAITKERLALEKKQREDDKKADKAIDMQAVAEKKAIDAKVAQHKSDVADVERDEVSPVPNASDATEAAQLDPALPAEVPQEAAVNQGPPAEAYSGQTEYDSPLEQMLADQTKPDPKQIELEQKLMEAFGTRMGQSQGEIDRLKTLRNDLAKPSTATDYSSLIRALDAFSGENNIKYYTPPKNPKEEVMQQAGMQEKIAKLQGGMADDQLNFLKAMLKKKTDTRQVGMLFKLKMAEQRQKRYEDKRLNKYNIDLTKDFNKIDDKVRKGSLAYNNLSALLAPDENGEVDSQKVKQALSIFARKISGEKGVLTEKDVGRVLPRNIAMDWATVRSYFNPTTPSEKLGGDFVKNLRQAITAVRGNEVEAWRENITAKRKRGVINRFSGDLWKPGSEWDIISRDKIKEIEDAYGDTGDFAQPTATPDAGLQKPPQVEQADWDTASDQDKAALIGHFSR